MTTPTQDRAGVVAPPPLIYLGFLTVGLVVNHLAPLVIPRMARVPGAVLVLLGAALLVSSVRTMRRAQTNVSPYKPTTAITSSGPYDFSRNPIYVGFALIYLGVALVAGALWPILMFPILVVVVSVFVIAREERYLTTKFGADYLGYKSRVRRWI
jgi:protein-S-isoprenylcysteine O-methyltransferase Ste14